MRSNLTQEESEYFRLIESSAFELKNHAEIKKNKLFPINALFPSICRSNLLSVNPAISVSTLNAFFDTKWCATIISIAKIFNNWKLLCFLTIISPCILCNLCTLYVPLDHNATVTHKFVSAGTHCVMKNHIYMPVRTHNSVPTSLTVFYRKSCVLQHFIAMGVPSFIPDDTIIAVENYYYMPDLTQYATVTYALISAGTNSHWPF